MTGQPVLRAQGLSVHYPGRTGPTCAVDDVSFSVDAGEVVALVGESGCGKSSAAMALAGLLPRGVGVEGAVWLDGQDLAALPERRLSSIRGRDLGVVFQEPMTSLNPVLTVGRQVGEVLRRHTPLPRRAVAARTAELFERVGIPDPHARVRAYPHQLSGGMRQRVMIAMAIACRPRVIIADEPTTALDVTVQQTILRLLRDLNRQDGTAIVLITHDLGVVAETADQVAIMYSGRIVEHGSTDQVFHAPAHPYTRALLACTPRPGEMAGTRLNEIPGTVPAVERPMASCAFADRCDRADETCRTVRPEQARAADHLVWCFHPEREEHMPWAAT